MRIMQNCKSKRANNSKQNGIRKSSRVSISRISENDSGGGGQSCVSWPPSPRKDGVNSVADGS